MSHVVRFLVVAFLIWLIPFVVSLPFFDREGQLRTNFWLFKGLMALVLSVSSLALMRWLARSWSPPPRPSTMALLGLGALAVSVALDALTVIPLTQIGPTAYLVQIAALYLLIVPLSVVAGMQGRATEV